MEPIEQLCTWVKESDNIVFFGGAGVSTESGLPDFRGVAGLYRQQSRYPPETLLGSTFSIASIVPRCAAWMLNQMQHI